MDAAEAAPGDEDQEFTEEEERQERVRIGTIAALFAGREVQMGAAEGEAATAAE
jgi:hypothetical protein